MKKIILGVLVLTVGIVSFFSFKGQASENRNGGYNYEILQKWDLPKELDEISGIAWIGNDRIACIQDEDGTIFIYNLKTSRIESQTDFGKGGDYEGIAVIQNDAYVLRSDGVIFEVPDFMSGNSKVQQHITHTNDISGINLESMCADPANNRLLLAVKDGKGYNESKGVYAFDLKQKASDKNPLFTLRLSDPIFEKIDEKLKNKFSPGEINIHPETGEYYILDGTRPKLLITKKDGTPIELIMFRNKDFGNPEGLTFNSKGDLYISNEAESDPANILRVSIQRKVK